MNSDDEIRQEIIKLKSDGFVRNDIFYHFYKLGIPPRRIVDLMERDPQEKRLGL